MTPSHPLIAKQPVELTEKIRLAALELGFCDVGFVNIATGQAHPHWQQASEHLQTWLGNDYHAHMAWMTTHQDLRTQLDGLLPDAKTIVVVALNHYQGAKTNSSINELENNVNQASKELPEQSLKIAQYAWGKDYHRLIRKRLQKLLAQIQQWVPHCQGRPVTDSAPLLEKPLAQLAGLGWQGKNSLLISKQHGSYLFLGELLLDIELPELLNQQLEPHASHCGTCTRCLDACPTNAFPEPGVLDSNRCISTWTIERPEGTPIPPDIADNLNGWIFGCDICQQVCPWNITFAKPTDDPAFTPRPWLQAPSTEDILSMSNESFTELAANNPLKRTGLAVLQETVKTVLANGSSTPVETTISKSPKAAN